ncbi:MAG: nucleotidyltransferase family protein [Candidatus Saccharimonadaceae bacterium]
MKAMIFAAGLGTRLKPITNTMPKALVPILGKPLIEHVIEKLKSAGFNEIIINIHHFGDQIIDFIKLKNNFDIRIEFSDERDKLLGTGGAIKKASWFFDNDKPVLIHNVDILSDVDLGSVYNQHIQNNATATLVVSDRDTFRYLLFDEFNSLQGWINKKSGEIKSPHQNFNSLNYKELAFSGIHVISSNALQYIKGFPHIFSIIDFYLSICNKEIVQAYIAQENSMIDVGKLASLKKAEEFIQSKNSRNSL